MGNFHVVVLLLVLDENYTLSLNNVCYKTQLSVSILSLNAIVYTVKPPPPSA